MASTPTKALVLGGGGPAGRAWHAGLLAGFRSHGIDLGLADTIIGTSAGAVVGAQLALRLDLAYNVPVYEANSLDAGPSAPSATRTAGLQKLRALCAQSTVSATPEADWQAIGELSLASETPSEAESLGRPSMAAFVGREWPKSYRATTANARTGAFRVWTAADHVSLERGVAASAALPCVWPAITMGDEGDGYVDGGVRSMVNADLAKGHTCVVVVSCFPLVVTPGDEGDVRRLLNQKVLDGIESLKHDGSAVFVITPSEEMLALTSNGTNMLDVSLVPGVFEAGKQHASRQVDNLRRIWNGQGEGGH